MTVALIGKRIGNYDIQAKLGEGGMGAVFLGLHPQIGKRVAIKILHEELASKEDVVKRFFTEAKAVNDISHPNIVDIVDFGDTTLEGAIFKYIIMEFLDGESLAARIRRDGVSIRETLYIISQCGSALAASHRKGVIHRDLKPENIYLCTRSGDRNYVKLLDFGIAKLTGDGAAMSQKTRTGMVIGTPSYMSPEQCEGRGLIDHRSDIYSLGVVMYELLTGRVPFPGDGFGEVLVAHLTRDPPPPTSLNPNIPPEIEAIVLHCLRKDRTTRFQSMDELIAAINDPVGHYQSGGQTAQLPPGAMAADAGMGTILLGAGQRPSGMQPMMAPPPNGGTGAASAPWALPHTPVPGMHTGLGPAAQVGQMQMAVPVGSEAVRMTGMAVRSNTGQQGVPQDVVKQTGQGPRPTTLSGTAGETGPGGRRPVSVLLGFSGAMLVGVLAMVGYRVLLRPPEVVAVPGPGPRIAVQQPPPTPTPSQPQAQLVTVTIETTPPGAEVNHDDVLDNGGKVLVTPARLQVKKGTTLGLKLKLDGYNDELRSLSVDKDATVAVTLTRVAKVETPRPVPVDTRTPEPAAGTGDKTETPGTGDPGQDDGKGGKHHHDHKGKHHRDKDKDKRPDEGLQPMF